MLGSTDKPFKVTDENMEQIKTRYRGLVVLISKRCPICQSYLVCWRCSEWNRDAQGNRLSHSVGVQVVCPFCRRATVDDPWMSDNDSPSMAVIPNTVGWVQCPNCGKRFDLANHASWNGESHRTCGQRLNIRMV